MTFRQVAGNNCEMAARLITVQLRRARAGAFVCAVAVALSCAVLTPLAVAQTGDENKLTWDYAVPPSEGIICDAAAPKGVDCIQSFVIAYQTGKNKFKAAATLKASDICVRRTEKGSGWTCSAAIPVVPGKKGKPMTWAVGAVTASGLKSDYSNTVTK